MRESIFIKEMNGLLDDGEVSLGEVSDKLKSKGLVFLSLVCILPFMQPIPIPGLSTVLGFVLILQGVGLAIFSKPVMTPRMRELRLSPKMVARFIQAGKKVFPWIGWFVKPRGQSWVHHRLTHALSGTTIVLLSLFLSLPLPLPSSNFLPAIGIFFICLGLLEDDLILVILGLVYALVFGLLLSVAGHLIISELMDSRWWGRYF